MYVISIRPAPFYDLPNLTGHIAHCNYFEDSSMLSIYQKCF